MKQKRDAVWHPFLLGSGIRIRTSTYGVRVRCATVTQYRYIFMLFNFMRYIKLLRNLMAFARLCIARLKDSNLKYEIKISFNAVTQYRYVSVANDIIQCSF